LRPKRNAHVSSPRSIKRAIGNASLAYYLPAWQICITSCRCLQRIPEALAPFAIAFADRDMKDRSDKRRLCVVERAIAAIIRGSLDACPFGEDSSVQQQQQHHHRTNRDVTFSVCREKPRATTPHHTNSPTRWLDRTTAQSLQVFSITLRSFFPRTPRVALLALRERFDFCARAWSKPAFQAQRRAESSRFKLVEI